MVCGQKETADQALGEWHADHRLMQDTARPEQLLGEQRNHGDPAADGLSRGRHRGPEVDLGSYRASERTCKSIFDSVAIDHHSQQTADVTGDGRLALRPVHRH